MGFWKTSHEHETKGEQKSKLGPTHTDSYHVDNSGKRDQPHSLDVKISGPKIEPSMRDIHPSSKK